MGNPRNKYGLFELLHLQNIMIQNLQTQIDNSTDICCSKNQTRRLDVDGSCREVQAGFSALRGSVLVYVKRDRSRDESIMAESKGSGGQTAGEGA